MEIQEGSALSFMTRVKTLTYKEAHIILAAILTQNTNQVYGIPPAKPRGGELFLFSSGGIVDNTHNWMCD